MGVRAQSAHGLGCGRGAGRAQDRAAVTIVGHVGSAHTDAELGVLLERARRIAPGDQDVLDIEVAVRTSGSTTSPDWRAGTLTPSPGGPKGAPAPPGRTTATSSRLLYDVLGAVYDWLGFDVVDDAVFRDLVIARIVEPTSKADAARVLTDLGVEPVSYKTIQRHLAQSAPATTGTGSPATMFDSRHQPGRVEPSSVRRDDAVFRGRIRRRPA